MTTPVTAQLPATAPRLLLPPPFRAYAVGAGDILDLAQARAAEGAGTLLWREAQGILSLAVVLEPAPPLASTAHEAELGFQAGMAALCDMLAQHGQPERSIRVIWPDELHYDAARIGGGRWRQGPLGADGLPVWVIFAAELTASREGLADPGLYPQSTSLEEEEFPDAATLVESFAAWLKLIVDRWSRGGSERVMHRVLERVSSPDALHGAQINAGRLTLPPLAQALDETRWRDPQRGGPAW